MNLNQFYQFYMNTHVIFMTAPTSIYVIHVSVMKIKGVELHLSSLVLQTKWLASLFWYTPNHDVCEWKISKTIAGEMEFN